MKRLLPIVLFISVGYSQKEYNINHLFEQNSVYKKRFSDEIVNGNVYRMYDNIKVPLGKIKNGKKDGKWTQWYDNGQKKIEENFINGKPNGLATWWYENGQVRLEITYNDGKVDGKWILFYENGQVNVEGTYKNLEGTYKDGEIEYEMGWDGLPVNGKDGLFITWYENGQKKSELTYKDGVEIGIWKYWDRDGNLEKIIDIAAEAKAAAAEKVELVRLAAERAVAAKAEAERLAAEKAELVRLAAERAAAARAEAERLAIEKAELERLAAEKAERLAAEKARLAKEARDWYNGNEPFIDTNGNGTWDDAEWWEDDNDNDEIDEAEPFVDANGDGIYNDAEFFEDANDNDEYDDGEIFYDTNDNEMIDDAEEFTDTNENGVWDDAEKIYDLNGNGEVDDAEEFTDTNENGVWDGGPAMEAVVLDAVDVVRSRPISGWNIGAAPSIGYLLSGKTLTSTPTGATLVINTPYGFKLGSFSFNISAAFGGYTGKYDSKKDDTFNLPTGDTHFIDEVNLTLKGVGGNLTFNVPFIPFDVFGEGHVGMVGAGLGVRGFGGVSLESLMKKGLSLPFNVLVGGEVFISSDLAGAGNPSGWLSIGARLDYGF